jgi:surface protein
MNDAPPPTAKWQKTATAAAEDEKEPASILDKGKRRATATDEELNVMDLWRSLPANIVSHFIYPFAVKVIKNREELIEAVDEYLDEYYSYFKREAKDDDNRIRYPIGDWDVSRIDDFTRVFDEDRNRKAKNFNEDLSRWNVAHGTSFARMFFGCHSFQSDLSTWDTGRAINLRNMFHGCTSFNSDLSRWNVANATNLGAMFSSCTIFNSDLSRWNVANATSLNSMFYGCTSFNSDLSNWNVAKATNLADMFICCTGFNSDLSRWNVSNAPT